MKEERILTALSLREQKPLIIFETTGMNAAIFFCDVSIRNLLKSLTTPRPRLGEKRLLVL